MSQESRRLSQASLAVSVFGLLLIVGAYISTLVSAVGWQIALVGTVAGGILSATGFLFYSRQEKANERMDKYHHDLLIGSQLKLLLEACNTIDVKSKRNESKQRVLEGAARHWLIATRLICQQKLD